MWWSDPLRIYIYISVAEKGDEKGPSSATPFTTELVRCWKKLNPAPVPPVVAVLATTGRCPIGVRANLWAGLTAAKAYEQGSPLAFEVTATSSIPSIYCILSIFSIFSICFDMSNKGGVCRVFSRTRWHDNRIDNNRCCFVSISLVATAIRTQDPVWPKCGAMLNARSIAKHPRGPLGMNRNAPRAVIVPVNL